MAGLYNSHSSMKDGERGREGGENEISPTDGGDPPTGWREGAGLGVNQ